MNVRFGPSGNDKLFYDEGNKSSLSAPEWLEKMGLTAYEVNFGRGIKMGEKMATELGEQARKHNIVVSFHAPYYINLANPDPVAIKKSYGYIEKCLSVARIVNPKSGDSKVPSNPTHLVVHVGSQVDLDRATAIGNCKKNLKWVAEELEKNGFDNFLLCIETMGRYKAIGTYQEICDICHVHPRVIPTLDFGHINCVEQGALQQNPEHMRHILKYCIDEIGYEKMKNVHIHFSAIKYSVRGELAHTVLDDARWNFPFEPLARAIRDYKLEPTIICESEEIMAQDATKLAQVWEKFC